MNQLSFPPSRPSILGFFCIRAARLAFAGLFAVLVVACGNSGCAIRGKSHQRPSDPSNVRSILQPRIKADWQKTFIEQAKELKALEAWGLFSVGGWADDGQTMIFVLTDGSAKVVAVLPGSREAVTLRPVSPADVVLLRKELAGLDGLEDHVEAGFDAVQYEAVHLVPVESETRLDVKTRIMVVRATQKTAPKHLAFLQAFKAIRQARADQ